MQSAFFLRGILFFIKSIFPCQVAVVAGYSGL